MAARWALDDAGGHAMMVRRLGSGSEVVWIHGLGEWSVGFEAAAAHPALAGFAHVLLDLPGYGRSPWPEAADGGAAAAGAIEIDDLERLADRLAVWLAARTARAGGEPPALIGHSMGGVLATLVAERAAVRAVVDVEGNLSRGDCVFSARVAAYAADDFAARGLAELRADTYERGLRDLPLRGYAAAMCVASPRVFHRHAVDLVRLSEAGELAGRLAALRVPVLYIAGVPDGICAHSRELLDRHGIR